MSITNTLTPEQKAELARLKKRVEEEHGKLRWTDDGFFGGSSWADHPDKTGTVIVLLEPPEGERRIKYEGRGWGEPQGEDAPFDLDESPELESADEAEQIPDDAFEPSEPEPDDFDQSPLDLPHIGGGKVDIGPLGATVTGDLTFDEWHDVCKSVLRLAKAMPWIIGDMLNYGEAAYGEQWAQILAVAEQLDLSPNTVGQWKSVAGRIPMGERVEDVAWKCWTYLAGKTPAERKQGVDAYLGGLTTDQVRELLSGDDDKMPPVQRPPCPICGGETTGNRCKACGAGYSAVAWYIHDHPEAQPQRGPEDLPALPEPEEEDDEAATEETPGVGELREALVLVRETLLNGANPPGDRIRWSLEIIATMLAAFEGATDEEA